MVMPPSLCAESLSQRDLVLFLQVLRRLCVLGVPGLIDDDPLSAIPSHSSTAALSVCIMGLTAKGLIIQVSCRCLAK
jgi:hypothetical protein